MNDELEVKKRILTKTDEMFLTFGFSKVTMDEIASEIGISKKTLYKHFESKEHLIKELVQEKKCATGSVIDKIINDDSLEFMDKLKQLMVVLKEKSRDMRGPMMRDMMRTYPAIFEEIKEFRHQHAICQFEKLLTEGSEKGIFRKDIDKSLVTMVYINAIHEIMVPEVLATLPLSPEQVFMSLVKIVFEGILTEEGRINMVNKGKREEDNYGNN